MKKIWLLSISFLLSLSGASWAQSRIAIPSYQDPGSGQWNAWRALGASSVGIMIVNLNNGDGTSYNPTVAQAIRDSRRKGIFVVGYVYTGYGQRDPNVVRKKVDAVFHNYLVDGIFFDEVPTDCNATASQANTTYLYYQGLADYVRRNQVGGRLVILNPGTQPSNDCWMSIANILVTAESSSLQDYEQNYQPQAWFRRYPPERFWHIVYGVPFTAGLNHVITLSLERGAGWIYVTDRGVGGSNPYDQPPAYWSLEGAEVTGQGVQAPYATFRPKSNDENGNPVPARISFRWRAVNGTKWQIFLDTDRNAGTGYRGPGSGLDISADYMLQAGADGSASLLRYTGSGLNWDWTEVKAHAQVLFPDTGLNLVEADADGLEQALDYQIRSVGGEGNTLFTSYVEHLSLNSTAYVFDLQNH